MTPALLLSLSGGALLLVGICVWTLARMRSARQHLQTRIAALAGAYRPAQSREATAQRRLASCNAGRHLAGLFGFNPARMEAHVLPWWAALTVAALAAMIGVKVAGFLLGATAWLGFPAAWAILARRFFAWCEARRTRLLYEQFPDLLGMIARAVRVGIPVTEGVRMVAREAPQPSAAEFSRLADQLSVGVALDAALRAMAERNPVAEYRFFATALSLQAQTGGGLTVTLDGLADVIRKRLALRARAHALASEARSSMYILAVLPVVACLALLVLNPAYAGLLFTDSGGQKILAAAILSLSTGMIVMRLIIRRTLS